MKKARVIISMEHRNFKQLYNELLKSGLVEDVGEETNAEFIRQEHEKDVLKPIYHHPDLITDIENISVINQIAAEYKIPVVYSKINKLEIINI